MSNLDPNPNKGRWPLPNGRSPSRPQEEVSEENPILAYERLMASLCPPPNSGTNTIYQARAVREIVPRAPASFTLVNVNSSPGAGAGMGVYEAAQHNEQRYTGTETWGPTGGTFQQSWEERRAQLNFAAMSGCGSAVGGVAGAVAAAIASGHFGGGPAGGSGPAYSKLEAALAAGYAQTGSTQHGFGTVGTSGFTGSSSRDGFQGAGTLCGAPAGGGGSSGGVFGDQTFARAWGTSSSAGVPPPSSTSSGRKSSGGGSNPSQGRGRKKKS